MTTTRTSTRLIAFCVCFALLLCSAPVTAFAEEYTGIQIFDAGGNVSNALRENGVTFNNDSSLHLRSTIRADRVNGANKRLAETTASFAAEYSDDGSLV